LTWWYSDSRLICTAGRIFVIVAKFLKFEKNMPHAVLMYRPKRRLTKRHHLRIVKLKNQQKTKFVHLNLSGIADVLWLATDGLENANLQHGELIWLDFHHILTRFFIGTLEKKVLARSMRVKGLLLFNHIYPQFFMSMAYRVNNMVDAHLTKKCDKTIPGLSAMN